MSPIFGAFSAMVSQTLVPNFHALKVKAPDIARHAKAGQFAIIMAYRNSERSPFTLIDWNAEEGWVKFIIEEVGRSSAEIGALKAGDRLFVVSGPLGTPVDLSIFKPGQKVLLAGGCYGIGAIMPVARALAEDRVGEECDYIAQSHRTDIFSAKIRIFTRKTRPSPLFATARAANATALYVRPHPPRRYCDCGSTAAPYFMKTK